jgi:hypothetical protein
LAPGGLACDALRMGEQVVKNRFGKEVARIRKLGDGRFEMRDREGKILGFFDPRTDRTLDGLGNVIGLGNQLGGLVPKR